MCVRGISPRLLGPFAFGFLVAQKSPWQRHRERRPGYLRVTGKQKERKEGVRVSIFSSRIHFQKSSFLSPPPEKNSNMT